MQHQRAVFALLAAAVLWTVVLQVFSNKSNQDDPNHEIYAGMAHSSVRIQGLEEKIAHIEGVLAELKAGTRSLSETSNNVGADAGTDPELEQKVQDLERELRKVKKENAKLKNSAVMNGNSDNGPRLNKLQITPEEAFSIAGRNPPIPLPVLAGSADAAKQTCKEDLVLVKDTVLDPKYLFEGGRKIPRIVHTTSLSRCNVKLIADNVDDWRFEGYSLFMHDDPAVERLLYRDWPEFPLLHKVLACLPNKGAIMADIWRVLVLWEYGGIYTDMDTGVIPHMFNGSSIDPEMDGFFVMAPLSIPTQWFMAVSPRHPMMYFAMNRIIVNLISLRDIGDFAVVFTTGPAVIGDSFRVFVNQTKRKHFTAGTYYGTNNRSVTIWGEAKPMVHFVRSVVEGNLGAKNEVYQKTGMTHIGKMGLKGKKKLGTCWERLHKLEQAKEITYDYDWEPIDN